MKPNLNPCSCGRTDPVIGPGPCNSVCVSCNSKDCYRLVRADTEDEAIRIWNDIHPVDIQPEPKDEFPEVEGMADRVLAILKEKE